MNIFQKVTLKTLKENKTRTIVTIIGILLSLSMFTAVTTSIASFQSHMLEMTKIRSGNWHISLPSAHGTLEDFSEPDSIENVSFLEHIGYVKLKDGINPDKPYLFIGGMDEQAQGTLPLLVTEGRLPENENELLIPSHLSYNGGVTYTIGDTVTLDIGTRRARSADKTDEVLWQDTSYLYTEEEQKQKVASGAWESRDPNQETEIFSTDFSRTYTIVGFYSRPSFESYTAAGYTALTMSSPKASGSETSNSSFGYTAFLRFKDPKDAIPWMNQHYPELPGSDVNQSLLRMYAASHEDSYNSVLYGLGTVLIIIILFGSISLIYNAFSISVSERTKQFGLLSSLGATKRQLIHSVLFEAFVLCLIGIPLGILAGIAGIGITFSFVGSSMSSILWGEWAAPLTLHVTPQSVGIAALIGLFTVLISAYLPARRSAKLSPIEAIRLTADIHIRSKKVRTSRLTYRLFGLSGMLASKNFKRNRKKYRATVLSLFVSVVLFISASSFCSYLLKGAESIMTDAGCDIVYFQDHPQVPNEKVLKKLKALDSVAQAAYSLDNYCTVRIPRKDLNADYLSFMTQMTSDDSWNQNSDYVETDVPVVFIDDASFEKYITDSGFDSSLFFSQEHPLAAVSDFYRSYNGSTGKYSTFHTLSNHKSKMELLQLHIPEGYLYYGSSSSAQEEYYFEHKTDPNADLLEVPAESCTEFIPLEIGAVPREAPYFLGERYSSGITLIYPVSAIESILGPNHAASTLESNVEFYFTADNHKQATEDISQALKELKLNTSNLIDYAESMAQQRTMFTIITIFSYGFIILISLIAIANVFNTISTNLRLRKREFAMLKSTGMTPKGFRIMMCYECLLYGVKGLLFGLPASVLLTFFIYRSISYGWDTAFYIPWYSVVIAVGSVFLVVGSTMIYSMSKIGKENIMDTLKNENA